MATGAWLYFPTFQQPEVRVQISSSQVDAVRVLCVHGRLDHAHAKAFETALLPLLDGCGAQGEAVVLDFSGVSYISSVGLRVLLLAAKKVKSQGGRIAVAALSPIVAEVFEVSHFSMVLKVHPTVAAAVAVLRS